MKFTTRDRDNDMASHGNCALSGGGWWHNHCSHIYLNRKYSNIRMYLNSQHVYPTFVTGFMKTVLIGTRNEIQFIADY